MLLSVFVISFCLLHAEANKIGLQDHSHEDRSPSSLKKEILKFKSSECGSSSSEESYETSKKKQDSNESDSSESGEDKKKRRRNKNNRSRHRNNDDSSISDDQESQGYNYGQSGPEQYPRHSSGRNPYQPPQYQDPYAPRNMGRPNNGYYPSRGGLPYPNMESDPYQRPGGGRPYGGRSEVLYPDRGTGSYQGRYPYQNGQETFQNRDHYSGPRNPYQNRQDSRENSRNSHHGRGRSNRDGQRHGTKRKSHKKAMNNESDEECVSQCIFNNMDIMEDDGIPSESAMIKWTQEKIKNDKLKTAAVKEIRKCFGTLASTDGDNSCEFSKSLASCLKLNLDED